MSSIAGVGRSAHRDVKKAVHDAVHEALGRIGGKADLAMVFSTIGYPQKQLTAELSQALGKDCVVVGCTGEGVITDNESKETDHALGVLAVKLGQGTTSEGHLIENYGAHPENAAVQLVERLGDVSNIIAVLVFPDGLTGNCSAFLAALRKRLPSVQVAGGTAADAMTFERTWQYCGDQATSGAASVIVLRGKGQMRVAVSHGCRPVSPHQTITKYDEGWVYEIDGKPAWEVFRSYLDGAPEDLNAEGIVHLCIGTAVDPDAEVVADPMIIRTPLALDKKSGALFFPGGGMKTGQRFRMTRRDADQIRKTAIACAEEITRNQVRAPAFVLQLDCAGRGKVMFGSCAAEEIVRPLRERVGDVPWAGFHTYGEIAQTEGVLAYHNYTVALCAFYD